LKDGHIQNPSNPFGIVPLSNFVPRGFGFVHHSIDILYHEVPNPNLTIRNFFIAVETWRGVYLTECASPTQRKPQRKPLRLEFETTNRGGVAAESGASHSREAPHALSMMSRVLTQVSSPASSQGWG
jgi:hypothetical protein